MSHSRTKLLLARYYTVGALVKNISDWNGLNSLMTWSKALIYIALCHRAPSILVENIMRSGRNVAVLICMFLLILWAYAQVANVLLMCC
jgi:hypothetical protein